MLRKFWQTVQTPNRLQDCMEGKKLLKKNQISKNLIFGNGGKMKVSELLPLKAYPFTVLKLISVLFGEKTLWTLI